MDLIIAIALIALIIQIALTAYFAGIATKKGHNGFGYGCLCFFFGVIGYCVVAALPDLTTEERISSLSREISRLSQRLNTLTEKKSTAENSQPRTTKNVELSPDAIVPIVVSDDEITCPKCNTRQRKSRLVCWSCGQKFS